MPKKLGVNTKAVEAKARKESAKKAKEEAIQKQKEDELWRDDNKLINRKLERQNERDKKRADAAERKAQNKAAYEQELSSLESSKVPTKAKVTRSQIEDHLAKKQNEQKKNETHLTVEIEENVNRLTVDGDEARTIEDAITILRYYC